MGFSEGHSKDTGRDSFLGVGTLGIDTPRDFLQPSLLWMLALEDTRQTYLQAFFWGLAHTILGSTQCSAKARRPGEEGEENGRLKNNQVSTEGEDGEDSWLRTHSQNISWTAHRSCQSHANASLFAPFGVREMPVRPPPCWRASRLNPRDLHQKPVEGMGHRVQESADICPLILLTRVDIPGACTASGSPRLQPGLKMRSQCCYLLAQARRRG